MRARAQDIARNTPVPLPANLVNKISTDVQDDEAFDGSQRVFRLRQMLDWMDEPRPAIEGDGSDALNYLATLEAYVTLQRNRAIAALAALRERSGWLADAFAHLAS